MRRAWLLLFLVVSVGCLLAQPPAPNPAPPPAENAAPPPDDAKARAKAVREYGKGGGSEIIPKLETYLADPDVDVRLEAVKAIVEIGTQRSLDRARQSNRRQ